MTVVSAGSWDKLIHFTGFFVLGGLAVLAGWRLSMLRLAIILTGYAALTEILQYFIPGRSFSMLDWLADALGIAVAVLAGSHILHRLGLLEQEV